MKGVFFFFLFYSMTFLAVAQNDLLNFTDSNGLKQGIWKEAPSDEDFDYVLTKYQDGKLNGTFTAYYSSDIIAMKGEFVNDTLIREHKTYYESGKIYRSTAYRKGLEDGIRITYFKNGTMHTKCKYISGKKHNLYLENYTNGNRKWEYYYKMNQLNGSYKMFYENGLILFKGQYLNGEKVDVWEKYDELGKVIKQDKF